MSTWVFSHQAPFRGFHVCFSQTRRDPQCWGSTRPPGIPTSYYVCSLSFYRWSHPNATPQITMFNSCERLNRASPFSTCSRIKMICFGCSRTSLNKTVSGRPYLFALLRSVAGGAVQQSVRGSRSPKRSAAGWATDDRWAGQLSEQRNQMNPNNCCMLLLWF